MHAVIAVIVGMFVGVCGVGADSAVQGHVQFADGLPVAGAQVVLFDLADLRRGVVAQTTTDEAGQFALSLSGPARPAHFALGQSYPNPFNPSTIIPYELAMPAWVRLKVFNLLGQPVATLVDGEQGAGAYRAQWDGTDAAGQAVAAGVYIYRLTVAGAQQTGRMVLVDGQAGVPQGGASVASVPTETPRGLYGLVVSGPGIVAYADASFRVGAAMPVVIEVAVPGSAKAVQGDDEGILGDVNNDGQVTLIDALLVAMYIANPSTELPNGGNIALGDMNGDGEIDLTDAELIADYAYDAPSFGPQVVEDHYYTAGDEVVLLLPEAEGGNDALTYSLNEADLPPGLAFDGVAREISGTPPVEETYAESYVLRYQVADVDGDAVTLRFTIVVDGIPSFVREEDDQLYTAGESVSLELPEAIGGNVARTYRLDGALPPGLTFDPATRTISGHLPEFASYAYEGYALTYRVKDVDDQEPAPLEFTLRVDGIPRFDEGVSEQITFAAGQTIDLWVLPSASGGNGDVTYELAGELPEGLSYDSATRTISGTLWADAMYDFESEGYALTYWVTDEDGDGPAALTFTIGVHGMPSFHAQVVDDQLYTVGDAVSLGLPEAVGGNGALTYTLEGELPPGLTFDGMARTISGTLPVEETYAGSYVLRYGVVDAEGDSAELRFIITIRATLTEFESAGYAGYDFVPLSYLGTVWGKPAKFTDDSHIGVVAYMVLGSLKGCDFADAEVDRGSSVYVRIEEIGSLTDYEAVEVCRATSTAYGSFNGVRMTHIRFFDESSPTNIREAVLDTATGQYSLEVGTLR